jgi:hypothetical protein
MIQVVKPPGEKFTRVEYVWAAICAAILLWMNAYICREFFSGAPGAHMNSMQGFWIALAKRAGDSWWRPTWWPFWDSGIPFEFTYAPMVPALTRILSSAAKLPEERALAMVTGIAYCLVPLTLFFAAWRITRTAKYSFAAATLYSLIAPSQILAPDTDLHWSGHWESRRLFMVTFWDETPHLLALVFLPLSIHLLVRAFETRGRRYYAAAALTIALSTSASAFAPIVAGLVVLCLIAARGRENYGPDIAVTIIVGALAYALSAAFLPPSLISAMRESTSRGLHREGWTAGSLTAFAIVILGWTILAHYLPRWTSDWRMRFFAFFAYLATSIPVISTWLHRQFLPQSFRYRFEMEIALALLLAFTARYWLQKVPLPARRAIVFLFIGLAFEQVVVYRDRAKLWLVPGDVTKTIEYRASTWADRNLPGTRVMFPGSIAQWANAYAAVPQFSGSSWSIAYNGAEQRGLDAIYNGGGDAARDARVSLAWLQAFGAGAVAVSSSDSEEYWKGFAHPAKFDGLLEKLWSEGGVTIYRVPQASASLAHVIPESAVIRRAPKTDDDIANLETFNTAVTDQTLPAAEMRWTGRNHIRISASPSNGQALSIQVSYHPGWHATVNGRSARLEKDGIGLMWLRPSCNGACDVQLDYNGGFEWIACRLLTAGALCLAAWLLFSIVDRRAVKHRS